MGTNGRDEHEAFRTVKLAELNQKLLPPRIPLGVDSTPEFVGHLTQPLWRRPYQPHLCPSRCNVFSIVFSISLVLPNFQFNVRLFGWRGRIFSRSVDYCILSQPHHPTRRPPM